MWEYFIACYTSPALAPETQASYFPALQHLHRRAQGCEQEMDSQKQRSGIMVRVVFSSNGGRILFSHGLRHSCGYPFAGLDLKLRQGPLQLPRM